MRRFAPTHVVLLAALAVTGSAPPTVAAQGSGMDLSGLTGAARLHIGRFSYDEVSALPGLSGSGTAILGITLWTSPSRVFGGDFDAIFAQRSYDSYVDGAADDRTRLDMAGFSLGLRLATPATIPVGVYAGGGLSYLSHTMEVAGEPVWFLPGLDQRWTSEDAGFTPYVGVGAEVRLGDAWALSLDHRRFDSEVSFDDPFSLSDVPLGGSVWTIGIWFGGGFPGAR